MCPIKVVSLIFFFCLGLVGFSILEMAKAFVAKAFAVLVALTGHPKIQNCHPPPPNFRRFDPPPYPKDPSVLKIVHRSNP